MVAAEWWSFSLQITTLGKTTCFFGRDYGSDGQAMYIEFVKERILHSVCENIMTPASYLPHVRKRHSIGPNVLSDYAILRPRVRNIMKIIGIHATSSQPMAH